MQVVSLDSDDVLDIENGEEEMSDREKSKYRFMLLHQLVRASHTLFSFKRGGLNFPPNNNDNTKAMTCRIRGNDETLEDTTGNDFVKAGEEMMEEESGNGSQSSSASLSNFPKSEAIAIRLLRVSEALRSSTDPAILNSMMKSLALLGGFSLERRSGTCVA